MIDAQLLQRLRSLVGRHIHYQNHACSVIEVLDSEKALVLRCEGPDRVIQGNQFGEASRRVRECHTLPLFDEEGRLNPVVEGWLEESTQAPSPKHR
ncbi:MAG TPA: hypothetical protein ENK05_03470 [Gammaproteobacteria bacterium]|nr:hypothetical protein [Gammaproteobacteria bacterium]